MTKTVEILEDGTVVETEVVKNKIGWICFPMFPFDDNWKRIKTKQYGKLRKKDSHCFLCNNSFDDKEQMGLMYIKNHTNVLCCEKCCKEASLKSGIDIIKRNRK